MTERRETEFSFQSNPESVCRGEENDWLRIKILEGVESGTQRSSRGR
jgi:hypothetical protein